MKFSLFTPVFPLHPGRTRELLRVHPYSYGSLFDLLGASASLHQNVASSNSSVPAVCLTSIGPRDPPRVLMHQRTIQQRRGLRRCHAVHTVHRRRPDTSTLSKDPRSPTANILNKLVDACWLLQRPDSSSTSSLPFPANVRLALYFSATDRTF